MSKRSYGDGSVRPYETASGKRWSATYGYVDRAGKRRQRKLSGFKSKADAQKAVREALVTRDKGTHLDPSGTTVAQYGRDEYLPNLVRRERAPVTVKSYTVALETWVFPEVGHIALQKVTRHDITRLIDSLHHLSPATVNLCVTVLGALMQMAVDDDLIVGNPVRNRNVVRPRGTVTDRTPWDAEEARKFLASLQPDKDDVDLAFLLMAMTGIRRAETAGLQWGDVNLDLGIVHVQRSHSMVDGKLVVSQGKTANAQRIVGLDPRLVELLTRHKMREAERFWAMGYTFGTETPVFATWTCSPRAPHTFSTRFTAAVRRAKVRRVPLHCLRHLAITQAQHDPQVADGMLRKVVGHASPKVTAGYTHADAEAAHKVAQSIATRIWPEEATA